MSYKIIEVLNDVVGKFTCMVSFDGRPAERYEVESLDAEVIAATLTKVNDEVAVQVPASSPKIEVVDGQVVI